MSILLVLNKVKKYLNPTFFSYFFGTILLGFSILFFVYHAVYAHKVVPGVSVAGVDLGGKTEEEAAAFLRPRLVELESAKLTFVHEGERFSKSLYEWGVTLESTSSARKAYLVGRSGNVFETTASKFESWFKGTALKPVCSIDEEVFSSAVGEVEKIANTPVEETHYKIEGEGLEVVAGKDGKRVNRDIFRDVLLQSAREAKFVLRSVPTEQVIAKPIELFEKSKSDVEEIVFSSPKLVFAGRQWVLDPEQVLDFLKFDYVEVVDSESGAKERQIEINIDEAALSFFVSQLANEVNQPVKGGTFRLESGRVIDFSLPQDGREIQEAETKEVIRNLVLDSAEEVAELPVETTKVGESTNDHGVKELLATGSSNFSGSSSGRIYNIDLASSRLDGILLAPGETFSFNKAVGDISSETGYQTSYVIKGGRTILGVGGGVCQVSTTMFRAALNAGLPIVERVAHAYRVHYYEQDKGPGFDATVYSPSPDFKFENNTSAHILIKRYYDPGTSTLRFSFYGTSDGRRVNITGPVIHSQTPPPEPEYIEDDSLAPGETEQVDWAAWGAQVTVKRKVTRGGEVLEEDSFYSNYRPWRAVYLVGKE